MPCSTRARIGAPVQTAGRLGLTMTEYRALEEGELLIDYDLPQDRGLLRVAQRIGSPQCSWVPVPESREGSRRSPAWVRARRGHGSAPGCHEATLTSARPAPRLPAPCEGGRHAAVVASIGCAAMAGSPATGLVLKRVKGRLWTRIGSFPRHAALVVRLRDKNLEPNPGLILGGTFERSADLNLDFGRAVN